MIRSIDPEAPARDAARSPVPRRILILGGGFAGVYTAKHLEHLLRDDPGVEVTLVSRDNFFLMTPLLFEACTGVLELRHCSVPIRGYLHRARFVEATVTSIDLEKKQACAAAENVNYVLPYDHLVLALGAVTNREQIRGSEHAMGFKTLADAIRLRNHMIERFERADAEADPVQRQKLLTFVIVGGGLVGVEIFGELTAFADHISKNYRHFRREDVRFILLHGTARILPELQPEAADYATKILEARPGVTIRTNTFVKQIEPCKVHIGDEVIEASTIVLAAGVVANPVVAGLALEKEKHGRIKTHPTMCSLSRSDVWALGDCAEIPSPEGKPYPWLAQHAMREAKTLAENLYAALGKQPPKPFVYTTLGLMAAFGHATGFTRFMKLRFYGFIAWWLRRTYYLFVMPRWSRRFRIVTDWTVALLFPPDIVKVDIDTEALQTRQAEPAGHAESMPPSGSEPTRVAQFAEPHRVENPE